MGNNQIVEETQQSQPMAYQDLEYIKLRIDTQKLHQDIYNFLNGTQTKLKMDLETNTWVEYSEVIGDPLANKAGIQQILSFVIAIINPHTIQGNTGKDEREFLKIIHYIDDALTEELTFNYSAWGIDPSNRKHILNTLMFMVRLILSRTFNNEERPSLGNVGFKRSIYTEGEEKKNKLF